MSPVWFRHRSTKFSLAVGAGALAAVATLALWSPRVRLADARVAIVTVPAPVAAPASPPVTTGCAGLPPSAPAVVAGWDGWPALAGITRVDATHYTIARDLIDRALTAPSHVVGAARVVPAVSDGRPIGFKLYALRPGSPWVALGLANGDTLRAINGVALTSVDRALAAYTTLRASDRFELAITRRGQPLTLAYQVVD